MGHCQNSDYQWRPQEREVTHARVYTACILCVRTWGAYIEGKGLGNRPESEKI